MEKNKTEMNSVAFKIADSDIYTNSNHNSNGKESAQRKEKSSATFK